MRTVSNVRGAIIVVIALYFILFWGVDAAHTLASPDYGLDDVWRSQPIFAIGRIFGLMPLGLIKLAAFFATLKFVVAGICGWHVVNRLLRLTDEDTNSEMLEGGLILIVLVSIVLAGPAVWANNIVPVQEAIVQLLLSAAAMALLLIERHFKRTEPDVFLPEIEQAIV